jgi:hypothetical protein
LATVGKNTLIFVHKTFKRLNMKKGDGLALMMLILLFACNSHYTRDLPSSKLHAWGSNLPEEVKTKNNSTVNAYTNLEFIPWGKENDISLNIVGKDSGVPLYKIQGNTGVEAAGFYSKNIHYEGKYVTFTLKNLTNNSSSPNSRVSFIFDIEGMKNDYRLMLVYGPLYLEGWINGTYYENIGSSSRIVNMDKLISFHNDSFVLLKKVVVLAQKHSTVDPLEFEIKLSRTIEDLPSYADLPMNRYPLKTT